MTDFIDTSFPAHVRRFSFHPCVFFHTFSFTHANVCFRATPYSRDAKILPRVCPNRHPHNICHNPLLFFPNTLAKHSTRFCEDIFWLEVVQKISMICLSSPVFTSSAQQNKISSSANRRCESIGAFQTSLIPSTLPSPRAFLRRQEKASVAKMYKGIMDLLDRFPF